MQAAGPGAFAVTTVQLDLIEIVAAGDDVIALVGHFLAGLDGGTVRRFIGLYGDAVVAQGRLQFLQFVLLAAAELLLELFQAGNRFIQLVDSLLFGIRVTVAGIATHFVARQLELFLGVGDGLETLEAPLFARCHVQDVVVDRGDQFLNDLGIVAHGLASAGSGAIGIAHLVQRLLVVADDRRLLIEQLEVFRALEAADQLLLLGDKGIEVDLHVLCGGLVAVGEHVLQAGYAQFGQRGIELGDVAHPVATVDQAAQAGPAGQGQDGGKHQDQAETQAQFQVDADISKPAIH